MADFWTQISDLATNLKTAHDNGKHHEKRRISDSIYLLLNRRVKASIFKSLNRYGAYKEMHNGLIDDVYNDIMSKVIEGIANGKYDPQKGSISTWVNAIANNHLLGVLRSYYLVGNTEYRRILRYTDSIPDYLTNHESVDADESRDAYVSTRMRQLKNLNIPDTLMKIINKCIQDDCSLQEACDHYNFKLTKFWTYIVRILRRSGYERASRRKRKSKTV
jgi:DNA-directed RNA polymerase specialized sigma24 family protein